MRNGLIPIAELRIVCFDMKPFALAATIQAVCLTFAITAAPSVFAAAEGAKASRILVDKSDRRLSLYDGSERLRSYKIALGGNPRGHKRFEGDRRTPEGIYLIDGKNPNSAYHLSLHISYPNERDRQRAAERGLDPGGQIMIHGMPTGLIKTSAKYETDWTDGCIAVSNAAIEEIWKLVDEGTLIEIRP